MLRLIQALFVLAVFVVPATAEERRYLTGSASDAQPKLSGPVLVFGGGSTDVSEAIQWTIDQVRGCDDCDTKLDVVVLRSTGDDGYNELIYDLKGVDSVETLVIDSRKDADSQDVKDTVRKAEIIFFAGGDQCNYVRYFKGTEVEKGVEHVFAKRGGVGGTSAGLAIQSSVVYDACSGESAYSPPALENPYYADMSFTYDFFAWPHMQATIADTHFAQRDRMGRLLAFLARQIQDGKYESILGLAVNEKTSVVVDQKGIAKVLGEGPAYFILADHKPEVCEAGSPLTFTNYKIWRVKSNESFDLEKRDAPGSYAVTVEKGKITTNPY